MNIYPHHTLFHILLPKRWNVFCSPKTIKGSKAPERLHWYSTYVSHWQGPIKGPQIKGTFESSLFESSGSWAIDSSLGSPVLFFQHATFWSKHATAFFINQFYIIFLEISSHLTTSLTCFSNFNKNNTCRN